MRCAGCGESTLQNPCDGCGRDPLLAGRYKLLEVLGEGVNGVTWRARCMSTGLAVVVKEVVLAGDAKADELWAREAAVLRQLDHPGIPRWVESFEHRQGRVRTGVLVQTLLSGESLATELLRRRYAEADALDVARGVLPILAYLHGLSPPVIHRDLKPSNVLRRPDGSLALVDFGSVRDTLPGAFGGSTVAGTFGFMAPEQFRGEASPATDLYGLGVLLVTLLTRSDPRTLLDSHGRLDWRPHVRVSPATRRLLEALLQVEPEHRPPDAQAALAWLPQPVERVDRSARRVFGGLLAAGVVSGVVTGAMAVSLLAQPVRERSIARVADPVMEPVPVAKTSAAERPDRREVEVGSTYLWNDAGDDVELTLWNGPAVVAARTVRRVPWDVDGAWLTWNGERTLKLEAGQLARFDGTRWTRAEWGGSEGSSVVAAWPAGPAVAPLACTARWMHAQGAVVDVDVSDCPAGLAATAGAVLWRSVPPASDAPVRAEVGIRVDPGVARRAVVIADGAAADALVVDGWAAGALPWSGSLSPGLHVMQWAGARAVVEVHAGDGSQLIRLRR